MSEYNYKFKVKRNIGRNSEMMFGLPNEIIYTMTRNGFIDKIGFNWNAKRTFEELHNLFLETDDIAQTEFELVSEQEMSGKDFIELYRLKRQKALAKLTSEEIELLGLKEDKS